MIKYILLSLLLLSSTLFSNSVGQIEKGRIDKFEHSYGLITRGTKLIEINKLGIKLQESDTVKTFRKSTLQIRLKDNTLINIGKRTTLKIENYLFDKTNSKNSKANFKIENGSFQIKTGKIGDKSPQNFKIKTKFSTIGLRG
jgi:hypothetical protein